MSSAKFWVILSCLAGVCVVSARPVEGQEKRIIVLDHSATMGWDYKELKRKRLEVAKQEILELWEAWQKAGRNKKDFTALYFDSKVHEAKDQKKIAGLKPSHVIIGHAFYEALKIALTKAWHAAKDADNPRPVEILYYTDSDLDLPSDTMRRLAEDIAGAITRQQRNAFFKRFNNLVNKGMIRLHVIALDKKGVHAPEEGIVLGLRGTILAPGGGEPPPVKIDWFITGTTTLPKPILLGRAERPGLSRNVDGPRVTLKLVVLPGSAPEGAKLRLTASCPGGIKLGVSPEIVDCKTGETDISFTLPKGSIWPEKVYDTIIHAKPVKVAGQKQIPVLKRDTTIVKSMEIAYVESSTVQDPKPFGGTIDTDDVKEGFKEPFGWTWTLKHGKRIKDIPEKFRTIKFAVKKKPPFEIKFSRKHKDKDEPLKDGDAWAPAETTEQITAKIVAPPKEEELKAKILADAAKDPATYKLEIELTGTSFNAGRTVLPVTLVVDPVEPPPVPKPIIVIDKVDDPKFEDTKESRQGTEFKAFSVQAGNQQACGRRISIGPARNLSGVTLTLLKLLVGDKKYDLLKAPADLPVPGELGTLVTYSLLVGVPVTPLAAGKAQFELPVKDGAREVYQLKFTASIPEIRIPPPPRIELTSRMKREMVDTGKTIVVDIFQLRAGNRTGCGRQILVGPVKAHNAESVILLVNGRGIGMRNQQAAVRVPSTMQDTIICSVRFTVPAEATGSVQLTLPVESDGLVVDDVERGREHRFTVELPIRPPPPPEPVLAFSGLPAFPKIVPYGIPVVSTKSVVSTKPAVLTQSIIEVQTSDMQGMSASLDVSLAHQNLPKGSTVSIQDPQGQLFPLPAKIVVPSKGTRWQVRILVPPPKKPDKSKEPRSDSLDSFGFTIAVEEASNQFKLRGWESLSSQSISSRTIQFNAANVCFVVRPATDAPALKETDKVKFKAGKPQEILLSLGPAKTEWAPELALAPELQSLRVKVTCVPPARSSVNVKLASGSETAPAIPLANLVDGDEPILLEVTSKSKPFFKTSYTIPITVAPESGDIVAPVKFNAVVSIGRIRLLEAVLLLLLFLAVAGFVAWYIWRPTNGPVGNGPVSLGVLKTPEGKVISMPGRRAVIGSGWRAKVKAKGKNVAGRHAAIIMKDDSGEDICIYQIADQGRYQTQVSDNFIGSEDTPLVDGATIQVGDSTFVFERFYADSETEPEPELEEHPEEFPDGSEIDPEESEATTI